MKMIIAHLSKQQKNTQNKLSNMISNIKVNMAMYLVWDFLMNQIDVYMPQIQN